jgi:hypothetical protein
MQPKSVERAARTPILLVANRLKYSCQRRGGAILSHFITTKVLREITGILLPFYRKIAVNRAFSIKWAKAVRQADVSTMVKLLRSVVPKPPYAALASNGIGYFIDYPFPKPIYAYTNATSLRPGTIQFTFNSTIHRNIAKAILPLYNEIVCNTPYAAKLVQCIRSNNTAFLERLIRSKVTTKRLVSIEIRCSGMFLGFRYPASRYVYYNEFFRDERL